MHPRNVVPSKKQLVKLVAGEVFAALPVGNEDPKVLVQLLTKKILMLPLDSRYESLYQDVMDYIVSVGSRKASSPTWRPCYVAMKTKSVRGYQVARAHQLTLLKEPPIPQMDSTGLVTIS